MSWSTSRFENGQIEEEESYTRGERRLIRITYF